jgi:hypothetical protein
LRFRSWLVAIAMNQVRRRWSVNQKWPVVGLDAVREKPDPAADFVDLTILRLGLSGQRREIAEATRWLDADDRQLLALWWLEESGQLTRSDLTAALERSRQHVAVQVQRMKERLNSVRTVVRALNADPCCEGLFELTARWDGRPAPVWRKRILRHIKDCQTCSEHRNGLLPAEALLAGLALVPPPPHSSARSPRSMSRFRALLDHPCPARVVREAGEVDSSAGDLDEEQHLDPLEEHRIDREEITGQHCLGLSGLELVQVGPVRCARDSNRDSKASTADRLARS